MHGPDLERALFWWGTVERSAGSEWERQFARSIARASRRKGWKPTPKQWAVMERLVADVRPDEKVELIE